MYERVQTNMAGKKSLYYKVIIGLTATILAAVTTALTIHLHVNKVSILIVCSFLFICFLYLLLVMLYVIFIYKIKINGIMMFMLWINYSLVFKFV